jgi:hypothetical protein
MIKKEAGKILKYKGVKVEVQRMSNGKTKVIPVIAGQLEPSQSNSENT